MNTNQTRQDDIHLTLEQAHARAAKLEAEARTQRLELERTIRLARGTRDIAPPKSEPAKTLATRLEDLLRGPNAPISLADLVWSRR